MRTYWKTSLTFSFTKKIGKEIYILFLFAKHYQGSHKVEGIFFCKPGLEVKHRRDTFQGHIVSSLFWVLMTSTMFIKHTFHLASEKVNRLWIGEMLSSSWTNDWRSKPIKEVFFLWGSNWPVKYFREICWKLDWNFIFTHDWNVDILFSCPPEYFSVNRAAIRYCWRAVHHHSCFVKM